MKDINALEALTWTVKSIFHSQKTTHFGSFDTWTSFNYKIIFKRTIYRHVSQTDVQETAPKDLGPNCFIIQSIRAERTGSNRCLIINYLLYTTYLIITKFKGIFPI